MAIEQTYRDILVDNYIKENLEQGVLIDGDDVEDRLAELAAGDYSIPQFAASGHQITRLDSSSAQKTRDTFRGILHDLEPLYEDLIRLAMVNQSTYERWKLEASDLEKQLIDLEDRIENLLLLTQDTDGNFAILVDNFTDASFTDQVNSTAELDLLTGRVQIGATGETTNRIFLENLDVGKDVSFKVRTTLNFVNRIDGERTSIQGPFKQESDNWWTNVRMKKPAPVTAELTVRLDPEGPVALSKIFVDLHHSAESSPVVITPLYSVDNKTFNQIPSNTFSLEVKTDATFVFPEVQAQYVKLILTKTGPDPSSSDKLFSYQFGFKDIMFFAEGFSANTTQTFYSKARSVVNRSGEVVEFEKLTLETCERLEDGTDIEYFISVSNTPNFSVSGVWTPVSPINRLNHPNPTILTVGQTVDAIIGDTETVQISHDGRATDPDFVNPGASFRLLSRDPDTGDIVDTATTAASVPRYSFVNSNDRILNYQIKDADGDTEGSGLSVDEKTLELFRNIGEKGLDADDTANQVRGIQRGWRFEDPYYTTTVEVTNDNGLSLDFGDKPVIIDDVSYTNRVDNAVLSKGIHRIKVNKANWRNVTAELDSLAALKSADSLYPYNHKLIIEGYDYGTSYPTTEEKIYTGVDLFAGILMRKVSIFDLNNNIRPDNYDYYALDRDSANSHDSGLDNVPTRVFVLKVDENDPDFTNERFMLRFKQINELRKYLRLRADFTTEDTTLTPSLDSYKIKLG